MTDLDLDKLEADAMSADVGVAWHLENGAKRGESVIAMQGDNHDGVFTVDMVAERIFSEPIAQHIVNMNPETTLALIDELRATRAALGEES